jgi:glutaconate CoA-transferase subunit A
MFEVVARGEGPLFMDPDADKARAFFRTKDHSLRNKVMTVKEAVEKYVHDGEYVAIGGFGSNRLPTSVCHEILRQRRKDLTLAGHTATHDFQIMSAGKVFKRCDVAYVIGLEARGLSSGARRYLESGAVECCEWSNYAMALRFKAAAMGVSFLPGRDMLGSDTFKYSAAVAVKCVFTGKLYCLMPALWPDVAMIHVHQSDVNGNCQVKGISIADFELARAAKRLIITCERLVPEDWIRADPNQTVIPHYLVDAVCEVPYGSFPGNMPLEYYSDEEHLNLWLTTEKDPAAVPAFLDKYIYGTKDFNEYLQLCGGLARMTALRAREHLIATPGSR